MRTPSDLACAFEKVRVLVIGDVMIDCFVHGHVSRVSVEGAPILAMDGEEVSLGGAGNVARSVAALGAQAILIAVVGDDRSGDTLQRLLCHEKNITSAVVTLAGRKTSRKTRFVAGDDHLLRVDDEVSAAVQFEILKDVIAREISNADIVALSDYSKGVLSEQTVKYTISIAKRMGKEVVADLKSASLAWYDGALILTPSLDDMCKVMSQRVADDTSAKAVAGIALQTVPNTGALLLTRGAAGMTLYMRGSGEEHFEATARKVRSTLGAGDVVTAALAIALAAGFDMSGAVELANVVAGLSVEKAALGAIFGSELTTALERGISHAPNEDGVGL